LNKTLSFVHLVHPHVKNVTLMVFVLYVLLTEKIYQFVIVLIITLKLWFKAIFSVKFVMLDVMNVLTSSIGVLVVLLIVTELMHQNVLAQMVT
jgi:energy-coupling factor transporter transmembrane protein EcfT